MTAGSYIIIYARARLPKDQADYAAMATEMERLGPTQSGLIEIDTIGSPHDTGITVCCWESRRQRSPAGGSRI